MFVSCVRWVLCRQRPLRRADHSYRGGCKGAKDKIAEFSDLRTNRCLEESEILIQHIFTSFFLSSLLCFFLSAFMLFKPLFLFQLLILILPLLSSSTCGARCYSDYLYIYRPYTYCIIRYHLYKSTFHMCVFVYDE
jgi:hypothetical protein